MATKPLAAVHGFGKETGQFALYGYILKGVMPGHLSRQELFSQLNTFTSEYLQYGCESRFKYVETVDKEVVPSV